MKKLLVFLILLFSSPAFAVTFWVTDNSENTLVDHVGGTAGCLDAIDGASLADGDYALICKSGMFYYYYVDATSGAAESSPNVIAPNTNAGTIRWILGSVSGTGGDQIRINHTAWPNGLSNEEIYPIHVAAGETLTLTQLDIDIKGGGTDTDLSVILYNETTASAVATETADNTDNVGVLGTVTGAAELSIRVTNATGSTQDAAITVVWSVR